MAACYLINLETSGNQAYIFASEKLRSIVGASELLYRVGTSYVDRALSGHDSSSFEKVISTSGKAFLLAKDREEAKDFIRTWSTILLSEAPGVDACAVCSESTFDPESSIDDYMRVFRETEKQMTLLRMNGQTALTRFQRIPVAAECAYSGLPASSLLKGVPVSSPALARINAASGNDPVFARRMKALFPGGAGDEIFWGLSLFEEEASGWIAVIHADGNGLGQLFINFASLVSKLYGGRATGRNYIDCYRKFSASLDDISRRSFRESVGEARTVIPVVVGGDDLTVVTGGFDGIDFARRFMEHFCFYASAGSTEYPAVRDILNAAGLRRLGMCAGISITKPHFPFSQSYRIAESLMSSAKEVKKHWGTDSIALDFHILYDSVPGSVAGIRDKLRIDDRVLTSKPYVVSRGSTEASSIEWLKSHSFSDFGKAAEAVSKLPSSQAHAVRDALFSEHRETQEAEWLFLLERYPAFRSAWAEVQPYCELYRELEEGQYCTLFLDALEAVKFFKDSGGRSNDTED